jgi:hypothetical protein
MAKARRDGASSRRLTPPSPALQGTVRLAGSVCLPPSPAWWREMVSDTAYEKPDLVNAKASQLCNIGKERCPDTEVVRHRFGLMIHFRSTVALIYQGAEVRTTFIPIEMGLTTYSEGMNRGAERAQPWDPGACRRR